MSDEEDDFSGAAGGDIDDPVPEFSDNDDDYPPPVETPYIDNNHGADAAHLAGYDFDEEEDHMAALDNAIQNAVPEQVKNNKPEAYIDPLFGIVAPLELLSDDFIESRWVPPNMECVNDYRYISMFNQGVSSASEVHSTNPNVHHIERDTFAVLSPSVPLYFQFLKSMVAAMFWMFLFSTPALILSFTGSRIPVQNQDAMGIYMFSIGNIGYDPASPTYAEDSYCSGNNTLGITEMVAAYSLNIINLPTVAGTSGGSSSNSSSVFNVTSITNFTSTNATINSSIGSYSNTTITCVHVLDMFELTLPEVSFILVFMEVLQVLVFLIVAIHLHRRLHNSLDISGKKPIGISSYTIQVTGLDPGTTEDQLIEHFSHLYPLDVIDWQDRPPIHTYVPVPHSENIGYSPPGERRPTVGTWVAEVSIHRPMRDYLQAYRVRQAIMKKIYRCRAQVKMYAADTPLQQSTYTDGYKPYSSVKKSEAAEKQLLKYLQQLDDHTLKMHHQGLIIKYNDPAIVLRGEEDEIDSDDERDSRPKGGFFKRPIDSDDEEADIEAATKPKKKPAKTLYVPPVKDEPFITHDMNPQRPAVAAFVVFEYNESMARCVEDYKKYSSFPYNLFYPKRMLLQGKCITVQQAPEPQNVVWGNFEVSWFTRFLYRMRTNIVLVLLLVVCFVIVLEAAMYKQAFARDVPDVTICDSEIPALYVDSYDPEAIKNMRLLRPPTPARQTAFDAECEAVVPGSFYARYAGGGEFDGFDSPIGNYSTAACFTDTGSIDVCPHPSTTRPICPCILTARSSFQSASCQTLQCYKNLNYEINDDDQFYPSMPACRKFDAWTVGSCYCIEELTNIITSSSGPMDTINKVENAAAGSNAVCNAFFINYSIGNGLTYFAIIVILAINLVIMNTMKFLSASECYLTVDQEHCALMIRIFTAVYINVALLVLIAFARWESIPTSVAAVTEPFGLLTGPFVDFTVEWYSSEGPVFVLTFVLQALIPILGPLWSYCCSSTWVYCCIQPLIEQQATTRFPMQYDLTKFTTGGAFDPTTRTGYLLALLFFCMTYAPGLPLLPFLCMGAFAIYFDADKRLLCRYYISPPRVSEAVMKIVVKLLPYAALLRLAIATWMFTAPGVLYNPTVHFNLPSILPPNFLPDTASRLSTANAVPLLLVIMLIVLIKLIRKAWKVLPFHYMSMCVRYVYHEIRKSSTRVRPDESGYIHPYDIYRSNDPLRQESAPYTGEYYKFIEDHSIVPGVCCFGPREVHKINQHGVDITQFSVVEQDEGWEAGTHWNPDEMGTHLLKAMKWRTTVRLNGINRLQGDLKRTYEVIAGVGRINSYSLDRIPAWQMQMHIEEGNNFHLRMQAENRRTVHTHGTGRDLIGILSIDNFGVKTHHKYKAKRAMRIKKQNNWALGKADLQKEEVVKVKLTKEQKNEKKGAAELYGAYNEEISDSSSSSEDEDHVYGFANKDSDCSSDSSSSSDEDRLV